eukprot:NODE_2387_length_1191_cov_28.406955_g2273_i0.p1 GENE.NODE_2387_length_1191_cov_28.406955_g2273_i0~~NODE_2387_length_1191_cov_28.406955_g2273_i0.p1  ORF type:complete len:376 (+),score=64.15 NODE_2387_length_1191_cov_28.406955_g2273_i0:22-1128(+)
MPVAKALKASEPLYSVGHSAELFAFWNEKWYPITVVQPAVKDSKGRWQYEIQWAGYEDQGTLEQPTNQSTYPESWIWPKKQIPLQQLPKPSAQKAPVKHSKPAPVKRKPKVDAEPAPKLNRKVHKATVSESASTPTPNRTTSKDGILLDASLSWTTPQGQYAHPYKWQYSDPKAGPTWQDYDIITSNKIEDAYQSWVSNPGVDVRSVHNGHHNYMVDFHKMVQTNVDPLAAAAPLQLLRSHLSGGEAMHEAKTISQLVAVQRQQSQRSQLSRTGSQSTQPTPSSIPIVSAETPQWRPISDKSEVVTGMTVRVLEVPVSGYQYENPAEFGKLATVCAVQGYPPVHLLFDDGHMYWYEFSDLLVRTEAPE